MFRQFALRLVSRDQHFDFRNRGHFCAYSSDTIALQPKLSLCAEESLVCEGAV